MSNSLPNKDHDDVHRHHDSTVHYIFYEVRRRDSSKLVKITERDIQQALASNR